MQVFFSAVRRKRIIIIVAAVLVAGVIGTVAAGFGQRMFAPAPPPAAAAAPSTPNSAPADFVEFRSEQGGFALSHPKSWKRLESSDPQVALIAANQQQASSFLVRVVQLDAAVNQQNLAAAKKLTDQIVKSNETVKLLAEPKKIELAGLPGYFYFYSFEDPVTKQTGAHSHFFVFDGNKMITIVFQSIPMERFPQVAPTFDKVTSSFRLLEK
jgi:hypothetical protein